VWADVCTDTTSPYSCAFNTTTIANGGYDLRAIATDVAGNVSTSAVLVNRVVDNTAPTATNIQATNRAGGTVGRPEQGDVVTYTCSEPMKAASILAGWGGASTSVVVRYANQPGRADRLQRGEHDTASPRQRRVRQRLRHGHHDVHRVEHGAQRKHDRGDTGTAERRDAHGRRHDGPEVDHVDHRHGIWPETRWWPEPSRRPGRTSTSEALAATRTA